MKNNRTEISWDNYIEYISLFGMTSVLLEYANNNMQVLFENESEEHPTVDMIKELLVENLSDESFRKLISAYKIDQFTNAFSEFEESKLEILIDVHYFKFTAERYMELKEISHKLSNRFALANKDDFIELLPECKIIIKEVKKYLKCDVFSKDKLSQF